MKLDMELSPKTITILAVVTALVLGILGYRWWNTDESYVDAASQERAGRLSLEQPVRQKMKSEGKRDAEIDGKLAAMWKSGELKLPPGKPGVDWAVDLSGTIRMIPKPEDLLKSPGEDVAARPPSADDMKPPK
jgi:hypothetical protein